MLSSAAHEQNIKSCRMSATTTRRSAHPRARARNSFKECSICAGILLYGPTLGDCSVLTDHKMPVLPAFYHVIAVVLPGLQADIALNLCRDDCEFSFFARVVNTHDAKFA